MVPVTGDTGTIQAHVPTMILTHPMNVRLDWDMGNLETRPKLVLHAEVYLACYNVQLGVQ